MKTLDVAEAARIIDRMDGGLDRPDAVGTIDLRGVKAAMLKRSILYIAGTNEFSDWFEFNFDFIHDRAPDARGFRMAASDSGAIWHARFSNMRRSFMPSPSRRNPPSSSVICWVAPRRRSSASRSGC